MPDLKTSKISSWVARVLVLALILPIVIFAIQAVGEDDMPAQPGSFTHGFQLATQRYAAATGGIAKATRQVDPRDLTQSVELYDSLLTATVRSQEEFKELRPPAKLSDDLDGLIEIMGAKVDALEELVTAARADDNVAGSQALKTYAGLVQAWLTARNDLQAKIADCGRECRVKS